tara:strand:+ start:548 stop:1090 length:543 start_codon:yes stop_codon:yes gene_type:complete
MSLEEEMDVTNIDESFNYIIDPETNKNVLLESAIGQQVLKNYIEAVENGPDSKNIISTKMFYESTTINDTVNDINDDEQNNETNLENLSVENIYNYAKGIENQQFTGKELKAKLRGLHKKAPIKGNKVWIRRSNGKWQRAVLSEIIIDDDEDTKCSVYFRTQNDKVASKRGLDIEDILFY